MVERKLPFNQLEAAKGGAGAVRAFAAAGRKFTDKQDKYGRTAAMVAAWKGDEAIKAFAAAGGKFSHQQDKDGRTAAMYAAANGAGAITAFAAAGGKFTDQQDSDSWTAAMWAASSGPDAVAALEAVMEEQAADEIRARLAYRTEQARARPPVRSGAATLRPL